MANIAQLHAAAYGKDVTDKLNEIIDWLNGVTDSDRVVNVTVSGTTLTVYYINGETDMFSLQNTTYPMASTSQNGLMYATDTYRIDALTAMVAELNVSCGIKEAFNAYVSSHSHYVDPDSGGGGGGDGGGGSSGDDSGVTDGPGESGDGEGGGGDGGDGGDGDGGDSGSTGGDGDSGEGDA